MGRPMAVNLHQAGVLAAVWNRTPAKLDSFLTDYPATRAYDPADLAQQCELIILSVARDEDVLEVVMRLLPGLQPGGIIVDTSTVSAATARHAAALAHSRDAEFLDAPVSGGVEGARHATLAMMVGGKEVILERARATLSTIASHIVHVGPTGSGQAAKAVNQIMAAGINQAVSEALAFGQALGLPMEKVIDLISHGAAANGFLSRRGAGILKEQFEPGFKVVLHHKDLAICKAMAEEWDIQLPIVEMTLVHYKRLMERGLGDRDISSLFLEKQRLFLDKIKMQRS